MPDDQRDQSKDQIPTNLRLLRLVEEVAQSGVPIAPATLAHALNLPRATLHRLLVTAETEGYLQRDVDGRSYGPGHRLRALSANTLSSQRIRTERLLIMRGLARSVGETCNLAAPGRYGMVYLDRVETHWPLRIQLPVGTKVPFYCTASGKMYLSSLRKDRLQRLLENMPRQQRTQHTLVDEDALMTELAETKARGYAKDAQEFMEDMVAVAVPICDDQGRLLTTLSLHAPTQRNDVVDLEAHLSTLKEAAARLEELVLH